MPDNKITLKIVVNGVPVEVDANVNAPLHTIVPEALHKAKVIGQPPENWNVQDEQGRPLDLGRKIGTFGFASGALLSLSLKAGIGG